MKDIVNKIALITGSTHGIGKAIALKLAENGYSLVVNGASTRELTNEYLMDLKTIIKGNYEDKVLYVQADVSKSSHREVLIKSIEEKFNRIDVLVNNAGIAPPERKDILEASEESFEEVIKTNLQGPYFLTQTISNWMIKLKESQVDNYNPCIVNISSISSFTSSINRGDYCISKAGITMMTKLFAHRLSEYNIPVFEIQPGIIKTRMTEAVEAKYDQMINGGLIPIRRWGFPEDLASVVSTIVKGNIPYATGEIIRIDGGFHIHRL